MSEIIVLFRGGNRRHRLNATILYISHCHLYIDVSLAVLQQPQPGFLSFFSWILVGVFFFLGRKKREDSTVSKNKTSFIRIGFPL